jgi:hypothetical protein
MGEDVEISKPDARAVELSFRKSTGGLSKEEEEELKKLQQSSAMRRRARAYSDAALPDGSSS